MNETIRILQKHHSSRSYKTDPIPDGVLDAIIESAHRAPTSTNSQEVSLVVVRNEETRPSLPTGKQRPVPATAAFPPQSPVPGTQTSKGVAVKGAVTERVLPDVPRSASMTIQGKVEVRIRVTVDPSGDVSNAAFDSPGVSKYFANLALQAARNWRFKPAQVDDHAVSSVWILRFRFRQTGTEVTPVEASP
ncbi:MAG: TonB family protein [Acidobacteriaceae bacterium]